MTFDTALLGRLRIEPLDRQAHDRAAFSCGTDRVDNFLKISAARQQDEGITRVYVACLDDLKAVVGYYALNAHSIDASTLPANMLKGMPRYPSFSAIYLSMVGVHAEYQGKGLGSFLMADALKQSLKAGDIVGARFMVLDALNEEAARLYRRLNFVDLPGHEPRMLLNLEQVRNAMKQAAQAAAQAVVKASQPRR